VKSIAEQQQERRDAKLADVERQIKSGSLVVRKMTAAERAKLPAKPQPPPARRS
jgi:hypothetical protein